MAPSSTVGCLRSSCRPTWFKSTPVAPTPYSLNPRPDSTATTTTWPVCVHLLDFPAAPPCTKHLPPASPAPPTVCLVPLSTSQGAYLSRVTTIITTTTTVLILQQQPPPPPWADLEGASYQPTNQLKPYFINNNNEKLCLGMRENLRLSGVATITPQTTASNTTFTTFGYQPPLLLSTGSSNKQFQVI